MLKLVWSANISIPSTNLGIQEILHPLSAFAHFNASQNITFYQNLFLTKFFEEEKYTLITLFTF